MLAVDNFIYHAQRFGVGIDSQADVAYALRRSSPESRVAG
jgi:hypothetical protein